MSVPVKSFDDYCDFIQESLRQLSSFGAFKFCVWCVDRFEPELGEIIWDGMTPEEHQRTTEIITELHDHVERGVIVSSARTTTLQAQIESFGPQGDEVYQDNAHEFEPEALEFLTALSNTLGYCRDHEVTLACSVSETWINIRDYHADSDATYGLKTLFDHPDLKRELELQHAFISSLEPR
jgi:hypothetical protein